MEHTLKSNSPLVSVIVVSFNSSKTICETLDSVLAQTYPNIELIISDDGSKDNTLDVVKKWINDNRLVGSCKLLTVPQNTGTVKNLNRGVLNSSGQWIKTIAADDIMTPDCIEKFVTYVQQNECNFCSCRLQIFGEQGFDYSSIKYSHNYYFQVCNMSLEEQQKNILRTYSFPGPAWFYSRKIFDLIGGFDEDYVLMEEWPFVYKMLSLGYKVYPVDSYLVKYRISTASVCHNKNEKEELGSYSFFVDNKKFFYEERLFALLKRGFLVNAIKDIVYYWAKESQFKKGSKSWQWKLFNLMLENNPKHRRKQKMIENV